MKIIFSDTEQSIETNEITEFQNKFNINLPINYMTLILKYNGALLENSEYIDTLLSIKYGELKVEDIIQIHQIFENNIPKDFFPFATDWSNNPITICLKQGDDYGKIFAFYFDVDRIKVIANSLEELFGVKSIDEL